MNHAFRLATCPRCRRPGLAPDEDGHTCMWCARTFPEARPVDGRCWICRQRPAEGQHAACLACRRPEPRHILTARERQEREGVA